MSYAPIRIKQPDEVRLLTFDFTGKLASGDTLSGVVGGVLSGTGVTFSAPSITGNTVTSLVSGGSAIHRISCRVTTTLGETLELDVDLSIVDGEN